MGGARTSPETVCEFSLELNRLSLMRCRSTGFPGLNTLALRVVRVFLGFGDLIENARNCLLQKSHNKFLIPTILSQIDVGL